VIGYSPKEEAEAAFLSEVCSEVLYFPMYKDVQSLPEKVRIVREKVTGIEKLPEAMKVLTSENAYETDGVFVLREAIAPGQLVPGLQTEGAHVTVDLNMAASLPGVFACGDIAGMPYQYIKAAGQGNIAALSAVSYLDKQKA
jgi:thioredoxin reductase (NADPH)